MGLQIWSFGPGVGEPRPVPGPTLPTRGKPQAPEGSVFGVLAEVTQ